MIVYVCPNCKRVFDSPSVCLGDGSRTESVIVGKADSHIPDEK